MDSEARAGVGPVRPRDSAVLMSVLGFIGFIGCCVQFGVRGFIQGLGFWAVFVGLVRPCCGGPSAAQ